MLDEVIRESREILSIIKRERGRKKGSKLSSEDFLCFAATTTGWVNYENADVVRIRDHVVKHTKALQEKAVTSGDMSELRTVQPLSRALLKSLYECLLKQDDRDNLTFGGGEESTSSFLNYNTLLRHSLTEDLYEVNGKADATVMFCECPILVWEDKKLREALCQVSHSAQVLAELKGFAEKFKDHMGVEAPIIAGILTSGLAWRFVFRVFSDGTVRFLTTKVAKVSSEVCGCEDEIEHCIDEDQATIVANMLLHCVTVSMNLIDIIKERTNVCIPPSFAYERGGDDGDDEADEDRDESDDDRKKDEDRLVTDFKKKVSFRVQTASKQKSNMSTKRAPFVTLSENTLLTRENLYKHDLGNDTRGLFW